MVLATVAVLALVTAGWRPNPSPWPAWLSVVSLLAIYLLWGRRYVPENQFDPTLTGRDLSWLMLLTLAVVGGLAASQSPNALTLQAVLIPLCWVTSRRTVQAVLATTAVVVGMGIGFGIALDDWLQAAAIQSGTLVGSIALGLWITRIAQWGEERQRLLGDLQAAQADLEVMHRDAGAAAERERMARDIHDTIAQSLTSVTMLAQRGRFESDPSATFELIESSAREALDEARALVAANAALPAGDGTLAGTLTRLGARFTRETGVRVSVSAEPVTASRDVEVVLLRCAQEALANVRKHSGAAKATVSLRGGDGSVALTIADDGRGYRDLELDADDRGFGLTGLRDRVALVGGGLTIGESAMGGALLSVSIPKGEEP
jgi:signal transduction histidine kinase